MSNSTQAEGLDISALQSEQIVTYLTVSITALYCYEWLVTLDQEVKYIWAERWTLSTWIFAVNRYAALIDIIATLLPAPTPISCRALLRVVDTMALLQLVAASLFSGLRVFALSGRNVWLFLVVFTLSMAPFATNLFFYVRESIEFLGASECIALPDFGSPIKVQLGLLFGARGSLILADVIVLVVTWIKTIWTVREGSRLKIKVPLSEILIRDGTLFFIALVGVNIVVLLSNDLSNAPAGFSIIGGSFVSLIPPIVISRFMLNLRQVNRTLGDPRSNQESTAAHRSAMRFNSDIFVGNMGESLRLGSDSEDDVPSSGSVSENERGGIELIGLDAAPDEGSACDTKDTGQIQEMSVA